MDYILDYFNDFNDLNKNGVEITLRVAANGTSGIAMDDDCGEEEIAEKIDQLFPFIQSETLCLFFKTQNALMNTQADNRFNF